MADYEVRIGSYQALLDFRLRLQDLRPALSFIGALTIAQAHRAFQEQKLGDVRWPARYPAAKAPFLNIAPVVFRAGQGRKPGPDDFRNRPALFSPGEPLKKGIAVRGMDSHSVEVGHPERWSGMFQWGGMGRIAITETTRKTIGEWLRTASGKPSNASVTFTKPGTKEKTNYGKRSDYAKKLAFVFHKDSLVSKTYPRPFLGMTPILYDEIHEAIARHVLARKPGSPAPLPPLPGAHA